MVTVLEMDMGAGEIKHYKVLRAVFNSEEG